jgi:hypothetical protein
MRDGRRSRWRGAIVIAAALALSDCGESVTVPPPTTNTPPVIQSLTPSSPRLEVNEEVEITAVVQDQETNPASLTYTWSSVGGTFTGTGASVRWRAPQAAEAPTPFDLTLTVVERYTSGGAPRENRTTAQTTVHVNDSPRELTALAMTFLDDFVHSDVSPEVCVRNFSTSSSCGRAAELSEIRENRRLFINHPSGSTFRMQSITFATPAQATFATVRVACVFAASPVTGGPIGYASGTCRLTNVYENWQWRLCESFLDDGRTTPGFTMFRF